MDLLSEDKPYVLDLSVNKTASEIIHDLSSRLESPFAKGQKIFLMLGNVDLNQSQLLSIKSLIGAVQSSLSYIKTGSAQTELAGLNMGIIVEKIPQDEVFEVLEEEVEKVIKEPEESKEPAQKDELSFQPMSEILSPVDDLFKPIEPLTRLEEANVLPNAQEILKKEEEEIKPFGYSAEEIKDETDYFVEENENVVIVADPTQTMYVRQTLRSGQIINYDGHVIVVGNCHPGSEIKATGDITVWGILGGIAHAGCMGNMNARIRALKMNAIQLRISDCYARRPDSSNIPYAEKTDTFTPEEARIINNEIMIFKMNNRELKEQI